MHQRRLQGREARGVLAHEWGTRSPLRMAMRGIRSARFGVFLFIGAMSIPVGCSGNDTNAGTGGTGGAAGGTGTGGTGGAGGGGDPDGSTDCSLRPDVDTYAANMSKKGKNNIMSFLLVQSDPGPPIKGNNAWKVKITGADGMPVSTGLGIRVWMPEHGHDSPFTPIITYDAANGTYMLNPINTSTMGGVWRISLKVTDAVDPDISVDLADFNFCIN